MTNNKIKPPILETLRDIISELGIQNGTLDRKIFSEMRLKRSQAKAIASRVSIVYHIHPNEFKPIMFSYITAMSKYRDISASPHNIPDITLREFGVAL